jgi:AcrR family transcriptional regulator
MTELALTRDPLDGEVGVDPAELTDTTRRLVVAAAQVFAERGYDGAGVQEIARRAGLTTGAIYSRFSGKAELLAEAIRTFARGEFDELFAQHAFEGRVTDVLQTVGSHLVTRPPHPMRAILLEAFVAARRDPEVAAVLREHLTERAEHMRTMIDDSKTAGLVDEQLDTVAMVHFAHSVGLGFLLFEAIGLPNPEPARWEELIDRLVGSIAPPADAASPAPITTTTIE